MFSPCSPCCGGLYSAIIGDSHQRGYDHWFTNGSFSWFSGPGYAPFFNSSSYRNSSLSGTEGPWYSGGVSPWQLFNHEVVTSRDANDYQWLGAGVVPAEDNSTLSWPRRRISPVYGMTLPDEANLVDQYGYSYGYFMPMVKTPRDYSLISAPPVKGMPFHMRYEQRPEGWFARGYTDSLNGYFWPNGTEEQPGQEILPYLVQKMTDWQPVTGVTCDGGVQLGVPGSARFTPDPRSPNWHGIFSGDTHGHGVRYDPPGPYLYPYGAYFNASAYFLPDYGYYSPSFSFVAAGKSVVAPMNDSPLVGVPPRLTVPAGGASCVPDVPGSLRLNLVLNFDLLAAARPNGLAAHSEITPPFNLSTIAVACGADRVVYSVLGFDNWDGQLFPHTPFDGQFNTHAMMGPWVAYGSMELTPHSSSGWLLTMSIRVRPALYIHYNYPNIPAIDVCLVTEQPVHIPCSPVGQTFNLHLPSLISNTVTDSHNAATCTVYAS